MVKREDGRETDIGRERMEERLMVKREDGRETKSGGDSMVWPTCKVTEGNSYVLMGAPKVQYISLKWTPVIFPSAPLCLAVCVIDSLGWRAHGSVYLFTLFSSCSSCLGFRVCRLFLLFGIWCCFVFYSSFPPPPPFFWGGGG